MKESKIETTIGLCVVALSKFLMKKYSVLEEEAYQRLMEMELYELLLDTDTRLYLESNEFLIQCCEIECDKGKEALYRFINAD
ncbi:MAG: hypothetical protein HFG56_02930 [Lachnospiraceae bacterium]|nr:hypothetical protein [Lachnospiraceae bacterium]